MAISSAALVVTISSMTSMSAVCELHEPPSAAGSADVLESDEAQSADEPGEDVARSPRSRRRE